MSREINFRGKILFNGRHKFSGEWIYGYYRNNELGNAFITETLDQFENFIFDEYEIQSDTLGQYTGFKDKAGVGIYEGDIVKLGYGERYYGQWQYSSICAIDDIRNLGYIIDCESIEVIGNIYDNPELLDVITNA